MKKRVVPLLLFTTLLGVTNLSAKENWTKDPIYHEQYQELDTCSGTYPSYWQDPQFEEMWGEQIRTNVPTENWDREVFRLSDLYPQKPVDDKKHQPWRHKRFDALFDSKTSQKKKRKLAEEYIRLVYEYSLQGNVRVRGKQDFDVCQNRTRPWFHMPFQTYRPDSGREFMRGLTREAPVSFSTLQSSEPIKTTIWAVGIFNATAAYTIGQVWQPDGTAKIPQENISFDEGAVVAKPLFSTASVQQLPFLQNVPSWDANISDPTYCKCSPSKDSKFKKCTFEEVSQQCPRSYAKWDNVKLIQYDVAVKDSRAPGTEWVFGTFVADGKRKKHQRNPWHRVTWLGLMWGNDTPPKGQLANSYPKDPRANGFMEEVINWDMVDELNKWSGTGTMFRPGHLGCNMRLNGPADNGNSSCMSCHGTASVPDSHGKTPDIVTQFGKLTNECVDPISDFYTKDGVRAGMDRTGKYATELNGISFSDIDSFYFSNVPASQPFPIIRGSDGRTLNAPNYKGSKAEQWISTDYSLQLSISLKQWQEWINHSKKGKPQLMSEKTIRRK